MQGKTSNGQKMIFAPFSLLMKVLLGMGLLKVIVAFCFMLGTGVGGDVSRATAAPSEKEKADEVFQWERDEFSKSPAQDEIVEILMVRMRRLKEQEASLVQREKDLELLKKEIDERLRELKQLQVKLESPVKRAKAAQEARFQHLVGVYSSMEPTRAAALLEKMDEPTVVRIFGAMKSKKVASILGLMDPDKAARISSALSRKSFP